MLQSLGWTMSEVEQTTLRLAAIIDELAALPDGPSPERFRLLTEQDALRAQATQFEVAVDVGRSIESLVAELDALRRQRTALVNSRGGYVTGESADSAGRVGAALTGLHGGAGSEADIGRLTARIAQIEDVLASRRRNDKD